jgi:hypothetical protein
MTVRIEKLSRALMRRSIRLLDMEYKPSEIAEELAASKEQIVRLLTAGAPARKDAKGHYWLHGLTFVRWLEDAAPKKTGDKTTFTENECYCVTCRAVTPFTEHRRKKRMVYGMCPKGHKTVRFISLKSQGKEKPK